MLHITSDTAFELCLKCMHLGNTFQAKPGVTTITCIKSFYAEEVIVVVRNYTASTYILTIDLFHNDVTIKIATSIWGTLV